MFQFFLDDFPTVLSTRLLLSSRLCTVFHFQLSNCILAIAHSPGHSDPHLKGLLPAVFLDCFALALTRLHFWHMRILTVSALGLTLPGHTLSNLIILLVLSVFHLGTNILCKTEKHKLCRSVCHTPLLPELTLSSLGHIVPLLRILNILLPDSLCRSNFCLAKIQPTFKSS